jgi:pimeloyl-ACP methyl ester carboxylesterase
MSSQEDHPQFHYGMEICRTRFKKDIISEFIVPARPSKKVIILCGGMPSVPNAKETMLFWAKKGFWVFFPRYRGTWESGGEFLERSPHEDILDVIDELPKGFTDLWSGQRFQLPVTSPSYKLFVFGGSFGGPAAILCSRDPRVTKAVAFASVIDWNAPSKEQPKDKLGAFIPKAFGTCYRFSRKDWNRLHRGELYNSIAESSTIDGSKLLFIHAKDDALCSYSATKKFAQKVGAKLITLRTSGHFGVGKSIESRIYRRLKKFISK